MDKMSYIESLAIHQRSENTDLIPVPGFGFFPSTVNKQLNSIVEESLKEEVKISSDLEMSHFSETFINHYKCTILEDTWQTFFPDLASESNVCEPFWDHVSCVPPTKGDSIAVFPCMSSIGNKKFDTAQNATCHCLSKGKPNLT